MTLDPFGSVTLQTELCLTDFPCLPANQLPTLTATTNNPTASTQFANTGTLGVRHTLTLDGGASGANSQGFDNEVLVTPEPSGIILGASGLLVLLAFPCAR